MKTPEANIVKLPNISATIPQLQSAIKELQEKGYDIPYYPEKPKNEDKKALQARFAKILGSAVNPVLREGNSDRRPAVSVKKFAQKNPHKMMQQWPESGSKARVAHMNGNDFFENEKSTTIETAGNVKIEFVDKNNKTTVLKDNLPLQEGEVINTVYPHVLFDVTGEIQCSLGSELGLGDFGKDFIIADNFEFRLGRFIITQQKFRKPAFIEFKEKIFFPAGRAV